MLVIAIISLIITIISLGVAIYQTSRISQIKMLRVKKLRSDLASCRMIVSESYRLLKKRKKYGIDDIDAISKLRSVHSNSCMLLRSSFQELSEVDHPYNEKKLKLYVSLGLISTPWIWCQAALFLPKNFLEVKMPDLQQETPDLMA
jgi:hypothetical protein